MKKSSGFMHVLGLLALIFIASPLAAQAQNNQPATPPAKKTVAVVDFGAKSLNVIIDKDIQDFTFSSSYIDMLNSELMTTLVNDPTFNVIDRARFQDLAKNGQLASATPTSMAEIGKTAGADYIVCGDVELLELNKRVQEFPGYSQSQFVGHLVINLRIVEVATSRIIYAKKLNNTCTAILNQYKTISVGAFMEELKSDTVRKLVASISENISPIQICAVHSGKVYLDRGEQTFRGGEVLEVLIEVDKIYDKDGNILDAVEEHVGKIRVDTVRQKVAIASILEEERPMQVGWTARRIEE